MQGVCILIGLAGIVAGVQAECVSLLQAAQSAGLNRLLEAFEDSRGWANEEVSVAGLLDIASIDTPLNDTLPDATFLGPTDEAFSVISDLLQFLPTGPLVAILRNHIITGISLLAADIKTALTKVSPTGLEVQTAVSSLKVTTDGKDIFFAATGSEVKAKVVTADVMTCIGPLHVIDAVMVPQEAVLDDGGVYGDK